MDTTFELHPDERQTLRAALLHYEKHLAMLESVPHLTKDEKARSARLLLQINDLRVKFIMQRVE
jgi:hypothetical protein